VRLIDSVAIRTRDTLRVTWAFRRSRDSVTTPTTAEYARIYSVNVTNTRHGGAIACRVCPQGVDQHRSVDRSFGPFRDLVEFVVFMRLALKSNRAPARAYNTATVRVWLGLIVACQSGSGLRAIF